MIIAHTSHIGITGPNAGQQGGLRVPSSTPFDAAAEPDDVASEDLLAAAIPIVWRGYAPEIVDGLLDRAATTIERLRALDDPDLELGRREQADLLHRTLLLAQTSADRQVAEAESLAASVLAEARARAGRLVAEAEQAASHLVEAERTRAQLTVGEALARRQVLQGDIDTLEQYAHDLRARLRSVFDAQAAALDRVLAAATENRPLLREIDLTEPTLARPHDVDAISPWRDERPGAGWPDVIDDDEATALVADRDARTA
jgi:cell division septum initiation protein DivIVA